MDDERLERDFKLFSKKKGFKRVFEKNLKYYLPQSKEILETQIRISREHDELVSSCAKILAGTDLSKETGFEFLFTDPLIEFAEEEGNKIFDLLFYNNNDNSIILVECKSQISGKPKDTVFKQMSDQISNLYLQLNDLGEQIQLEINPEIEFIILTFSHHADKVVNALKEQEKADPKKRKLTEPSKVKVWQYLPTTGKIQLHIEHKLNNKVLTDALTVGVFVNTPTMEKFHLPMTIGSHPYRIIEYVLLRNIYKEKLHFGDPDNKIFAISEFEDELSRRLVLGVDEKTKRKLVKQKTKQLIDHGTKYGIFEPIDKIADADKLKIVCQGQKMETVKDKLYEKYRDNWASQRAQIQAKKQAVKDYKKQEPNLDKWVKEN